MKLAYWIVGFLIATPGFYILHKEIGWKATIGIALLIWSNNIIEFLAKRDSDV